MVIVHSSSLDSKFDFRYDDNEDEDAGEDRWLICMDYGKDNEMWYLYNFFKRGSFRVQC